VRARGRRGHQGVPHVTLLSLVTHDAVMAMPLGVVLLAMAYMGSTTVLVLDCSLDLAAHGGLCRWRARSWLSCRGLQGYDHGEQAKSCCDRE